MQYVIFFREARGHGPKSCNATAQASFSQRHGKFSYRLRIRLPYYVPTYPNLPILLIQLCDIDHAFVGYLCFLLLLFR